MTMRAVVSSNKKFSLWGPKGNQWRRFQPLIQASIRRAGYSRTSSHIVFLPDLLVADERLPPPPLVLKQLLRGPPLSDCRITASTRSKCQ